MIFFFQNGRLGNQLFQYAALKGIQNKDETIVLVGFGALISVFENLDAYFIASSDSIFCKAVKQLGVLIFDLVGYRLRLFNTLREAIDGENVSIETKSGLIPWLTYCNESFFQSEKFLVPQELSRIKIKDRLLEDAKKIIETLQIGSKRKIFVHIRRGDYTKWPTVDSPAVLPAKWYQNKMEAMRELYKNPLFLIFSDDIPYVEEVFGAMNDVWISRENERMDFVIMTLCDDGILSASSFSWWAAYFARRNNLSGRFYAPLYWGGHRLKKWYPGTIRTSWIRYEAV